MGHRQFFRNTALYFLALLLAACEAERPEDPADRMPHARPFLTIGCGPMVGVDMNGTRAEGGLDDLLSTVNDLNIRIHLKDAASCTLFLSGTENSTVISPVDGKNFQYIDSKTFTAFPDERRIEIHCDDISADQVDFVEVIANYGGTLAGTADWTTVRETGEQSLLPELQADKRCMMYGRTSDSVPGTHTDPVTGETCMRFDVQLKRTRAMLSVQIRNAGDDTHPGLKEGVRIKPTRIRLCNVPKECVLTKLPDASDPDLSKRNHIDAPDQSLTPAQEFPLDIGEVDSTSGSHAGEHAADGNVPEGFLPLYLYENMQGVSESANTSDVTKYPSGIQSVADAKDPAKNFKCSYVEIEADYSYTEDGAVKTSGTILYRFFLGKDALQDFNVEGNHYYRLTLNLSGYGGAAEDGKLDSEGNLVVNDHDLSWRVDMDISDWGFVKSEYDFDSHFIEGSFEVKGSGWKFSKVISGDGGASWFTLNVIATGYDMANPTTIIRDDCSLAISDNRLKYQVEPMQFVESNESLDPVGQFVKDSYKNEKNYREIVIELSHTETTPQGNITVLDTLTIRQYAPIPIDLDETGKSFVFMERFEEYPEGENGYPWMFQGKDLSDMICPERYSPRNVHYPYNYGEAPSIDNVGWDTYMLSNDQLGTYAGALQSAAYFCYRKSVPDFQGAQGVAYYALPSKQMMEKMFAYKHNQEYGPFEPLHRADDYWTSSVPESEKTKTYYYEGTSKSYVLTAERDNLKKRMRAVYTHQTDGVFPNSGD